MAPVLNVASVTGTGGLAPGLVGTSGVLDISDITQFFYHDTNQALFPSYSKVNQEISKNYSNILTE